MILPVSSILVLAPLAAIDGLNLPGTLALFTLMLGTSVAVTFIVKAMDRDCIATLRRTFALVLASNLIWLVPLVFGAVGYALHRDPQIGIDEFVVGAFMAWSFELLVINGAFLRSTLESAFAAAIQPILTLVMAASILGLHLNSAIAYSTILGIAVLVITAAFLLKFQTFKTEGAGLDSLQTFQSFLKSWVSHRPETLEGYFAMYSRDQSVTSKAVVINGERPVALVLPGVHPGPFYPVGSYNLSELIYHELRKENVVPIVLHGVGGHERNLPTNELTRKYAASIAQAVSSDHQTPIESMGGPFKFSLGPTCVTTLCFGDEVLAFLSSAPFNTDDLEPEVIGRALSASSEAGADLLLVDAHNSIGGENVKHFEISEEDWIKLLLEAKARPQGPFQVGAAHSSEIKLDYGSDISDGGMAAVVLSANGSKHALVTADSNNVALGLRQTVIDELKKENFDLIELCTSDTHKSAARALTDRGYHALGEHSEKAKLISAIKELVKLAEGRLGRGSVTVVTTQTMLPLIGDRSLEDFAALTKEALTFAKKYAAVAIVAVLAICSAGLFV